MPYIGRFAYPLHVCHPICSFYQKIQNNQVPRRAGAAHPPGRLHQAAAEDLCRPPPRGVSPTPSTRTKRRQARDRRECWRFDASIPITQRTLSAGYISHRESPFSPLAIFIRGSHRLQNPPQHREQPFHQFLRRPDIRRFPFPRNDPA